MSMFTVTRLMTLSRKWTEGVNKEPATSPIPEERKSWTSDESTPVVFEPQETQLFKTELISKPSSQKQESDPATIYEEGDTNKVNPMKSLENGPVRVSVAIKDATLFPNREEKTHVANLSTTKETEDAARKETSRVKGMIAVERHSHNERLKELTQEKDELITTLETSKKETARVKAMIAVERHSHNERVEKLTREKNEELEEVKRLQNVIEVERDSLNGRVKELTKEMDELVKAHQAATKETQRVKSVISVERHSHSEESAQVKNNLAETLEVAKNGNSNGRTREQSSGRSSPSPSTKSKFGLRFWLVVEVVLALLVSICLKIFPCGSVYDFEFHSRNQNFRAQWLWRKIRVGCDGGVGHDAIASCYHMFHTTH